MSRLAIADRIDAALAVAEARHNLRDENRWKREPGHATTAIAEIIYELRAAHPRISFIRDRLDRILTMPERPLSGHALAWLRVRIGEVEHALGMEHHPHSGAALKAWLAYCSEQKGEWDQYVDQLRNEAKSAAGSCGASPSTEMQEPAAHG